MANYDLLRIYYPIRAPLMMPYIGGRGREGRVAAAVSAESLQQEIARSAHIMRKKVGRHRLPSITLVGRSVPSPLQETTLQLPEAAVALASANTQTP